MSVAATRVETPPHAPETGWARRLLGPLHVTGVFWFRIHRYGVSLLPSWAISFFIALFTSFFFVALRKIRAAVAANLEVVLGPCGWWERQARIFRTMRTFAWCLSERYERLATARRFTVEAEGEEIWLGLNATGGGLLLLTAHVGNWEMGSMMPSTQEGRRVHLVREAETDPRAQKFLSELLRSRSCELYNTHFAEDPHLGMFLLDALRHGDIVALQGDRPRCGGKVEPGTLFGRPFPLPVGPAALARAAGVPILPIFVFREGRLRYRCSIRQPIHVAQTADRQRDLDEALEKFAAELQSAIAAHPHQWFCFRKVWS
jgi:lauroyl/myristoyl acyltransferase